MADEVKKEEKTGTKEQIIKSQANYKGNTQSDRVEITIKKDGNHVKVGQKLSVHPTVAEIFKAKGLI